MFWNILSSDEIEYGAIESALRLILRRRHYSLPVNPHRRGWRVFLFFAEWFPLLLLHTVECHGCDCVTPYRFGSLEIQTHGENDRYKARLPYESIHSYQISFCHYLCCEHVHDL